MSTAVERAKVEYQEAVSAEREMQAAVVDGDITITAADLAEAEAAVRLAALRVQAAERLAAEEAKRIFDEAQEARLERAREDKAKQDEVQRAGWQRAIDSGAAARQIAALRMSGPQRPHFPREYEDMLVEAGLLEPREPVTA